MTDILSIASMAGMGIFQRTFFHYLDEDSERVRWTKLRESIAGDPEILSLYSWEHYSECRRQQEDVYFESGGCPHCLAAAEDVSEIFQGVGAITEIFDDNYYCEECGCEWTAFEAASCPEYPQCTGCSSYAEEYPLTIAQPIPDSSVESRPADSALHVLYRFFDRDGRLLYVGITKSPWKRYQAHARDKDWWHRVASSTMDHFDTRGELEAAEISAIKLERPAYNKMHNEIVRKTVIDSSIEETLALDDN